MRTGRRYGTALVLLALLLPLAGCVGVSPDSPGSAPETPDNGSNAETLDATVTDVVDGDTVDVRYPDGSTDTVRLLGVDTPETFGETSPAEFESVPATPAGRECLAVVGEDASAHVTERLEGESVTLRLDPTADRRGSYGRLLAYVLYDGPNATDGTDASATSASTERDAATNRSSATNLNYHLVAEGYARVYDSTFRQSERFYAAEADAQKGRVGVWDCRDAGTEGGDGATGGSDAGNEPTDGGDGASEPGLAVARIHEDAAGDDTQNPNDEYVVFENGADESLDLSGWTVADEAGHSYAFPDGTALAPGARLTLRTGSGTDSGTNLYWGRDSAVWNNDGDTVRVFDGGETVLTESYA